MMNEISLRDHPELFHGAARILCSKHGVTASRMTEKLQQFYSYSDAARIRAEAPSGVRIVLRTDAPRMSLRLRFGVCCREVFTTDIEVADCCTSGFSPNQITQPYEFSCALPGCGMRLITVHLPHLAACEIEHLAISCGAIWHPVTEAKPRILFVGDSITQGMTTSSPTKAFVPKVASALGMDFHNIAVGGAVMEPEVIQLAQKLPFDKIVVAFGVNDCAQQVDLGVFREKTNAVCAIIAAAKPQGYMITPIPWPAAPEASNIDEYRAVIAEECGKFSSIKLIDGTKLVPDDAQYFVDGVHPNDQGAAEYAKNLIPLFN